MFLCEGFLQLRRVGATLHRGARACGGHSSSRCAGLSLSRPFLLRSRGSRRSGSVVVAHGPSCSAACGIFPDQGSNPCPLHWQADSQPLRHQGSPQLALFVKDLLCSTGSRRTWHASHRERHSLCTRQSVRGSFKALLKFRVSNRLCWEQRGI